MTLRADDGPIWAQKEITVLPQYTAFDLYNRLQNEIVALFTKKWCLIRINKIVCKTQNDKNSTYNNKRKIEANNKIDLNRLYKGEELINLLRARSFGEKSYAYFQIGDKKYSVNVQIEEIKNVNC